MCKFVKGMTIGMMVGTSMALMLMPTMDKKTQRNMRRMARKMKDSAENTYDNMSDWFNS
ncbi:YtxH domain-containing protein [Clostridium sp. BJN0001]|uniref:YtxH domain-containing protein n=1 Tax=Clostridium sp. BJN0001 TaxID=2930219 RepID=UPI001FD55DFE|nr:YtxH domain-containing protein [Clostridium sp. BJN0001]